MCLFRSSMCRCVQLYCGRSVFVLVVVSMWLQVFPGLHDGSMNFRRLLVWFHHFWAHHPIVSVDQWLFHLFFFNNYRKKRMNWLDLLLKFGWLWTIMQMGIYSFGSYWRLLNEMRSCCLENLSLKTISKRSMNTQQSKKLHFLVRPLVG